MEAKRACVLLLGLAIWTSTARAEGPVFPPPLGNISDHAGVLSHDERGRIEAAIDAVNASGRARLAVATIRTTAPWDLEPYATELFNRWGVGEAGRDDGVLLLLAVDDRRVRIEVGDGVRTRLGDVETGAILDGRVVPLFREGRLGAGLVEGAEAIRDHLAGRAAVGESPRPPSATSGAPRPPMVEDPRGGLSRPSIQGREVREPPRAAGPGAFLYGLVVGLGGLVCGFIVWLGRRPPRCSGCGRPMLLLSEAEDDAHLDEAERFEERIGSVDHRVWHCGPCDRFLATERVAWFSGYRRCRGCGHRTAKRRERTISSPTYTSTGTGLRTEDCSFCRHHWESRYTIPRRQRPSSSSSSFSSSSRSRSSFGGGRSSGRGSSRSW